MKFLLNDKFINKISIKEFLYKKRTDENTLNQPKEENLRPLMVLDLVNYNRVDDQLIYNILNKRYLLT